MSKYKNYTYLSQAYHDCLNDYQKSFKDSYFPCWDYVVITAANSKQAIFFEKQLALRTKDCLNKTKFIVIYDDKQNLGSGGATLNVIRQLKNIDDDFINKKTLLIHSGGYSKRIPQNSIIGKLFSYFPHKLNKEVSSTLFDEILISVSSIPSRIKAGMMIMSGDVLLLHNPYLIDFSNKGALAISFKETVDIGKNHGIYVDDEKGNVKYFLHKVDKDVMSKYRAIDDKGMINIDTGAIILASDVLNSLYSLIDNEDKYNKLTDDNSLSLYGDFIYPMGIDSNKENYILKDDKKSLVDAKNKIWDVLNGYHIKLAKIKQAKFVHFGTSKEFLNFVNDSNNYEELGWNKNINSSLILGGANNSLSIDLLKDNNYYLENCIIHSGVKIGNNTILSNLEIDDNIIIPNDVVMHCFRQIDGKYICRIFGINDNPKENYIFSKQLDMPLWQKPLYLPCDSMSETIEHALNLYDLIINNKIDELDKYDNLKSLNDALNDADIDQIYIWMNHVEDLVKINRINETIDNHLAINTLDIKLDKLNNKQIEFFNDNIDENNFSKTIRQYYFLASLTNDEKYYKKAFNYLANKILDDYYIDSKKVSFENIKDEVEIKMPLRVNFAGGWSDTPLYCNENNSTVLNGAIKVNGIEPIKVNIQKINEDKIIIESLDLNIHEEIDDYKHIQEIDEFDGSLIQKACLMITGVIPRSGGNIKELFDKLSGGLKISFEVINIPAGSGLGTSSLLAAACIKAIYELFNVEYKDNDIYLSVLAAEQLMSTGGGYQDQVGGYTNGIKLITSKAGIRQNIKVEYIDLDLETKEELNKRFVLINTGQRRLARNILRNVIGTYILNDEKIIKALNDIQALAIRMKDALINKNIDEFAHLLESHWALSKIIDEGTSNTLIENIFASIDDLIEGKMICGAGGGGFLQVILKKDVTKQELQDRLLELFPNTGIEIGDAYII